MHLEADGRCANARRLVCLHLVSGHATNLAPEQRRHHLRHAYRGRGSTGRLQMHRRHRRPPHGQHLNDPLGLVEGPPIAGAARTRDLPEN
jgi:hypothetical protein